MRLLPACLLMTSLALPAFAQEFPEDSTPPLSDILTTIEANGARIVHSAEWESGRWEVVSCPDRIRDCVEEDINPDTALVLASEQESVSTLPPEGAPPASEIAALVEMMELGRITEIEFDDSRWEVDIRADRLRAEFRIDPVTAEILRCEGALCP